jgi:hypothetical protein
MKQAIEQMIRLFLLRAAMAWVLMRHEISGAKAVPTDFVREISKIHDKLARKAKLLLLRSNKGAVFDEKCTPVTI